MGGSAVPHLLVVDDEEEMCRSLARLFAENGFAVTTARSAKEGFRVLAERSVDLVLCDIVMPDMSGLAFLSRVSPRIPVILMTAFASIDTTRRAFKSGARDYLVKPFEFRELLVVVNQNLEATREAADGGESLLLESANPAFNRMLELARKFSATDMPLLLSGESGVGKEVIARYIRSRGSRADRPLVCINCAAIPETLLESELFGFERGAFTGAASAKIGKFEQADGGTLFLDEIGDMPLSVQAKMLRVLQDFSFTRLGGKKVISVDLRVLAATNRPLEKLIAEERFRSDLFHRLNGLSLRVPPLRERQEDLEGLAVHFAGLFASKYGKPARGIAPATVEMLRSYPWPGNVRELRNSIERAVVVSEGSVLLPEHLPDAVASGGRAELRAPPAGVPGGRGESSPDGSAADYRMDYMRRIILDALARSGGNRNEAAKLLKISRKTLYNRMKELGIRHDFA